MPLADRFREFPWLLLDLIFPFMMEYLVSRARSIHVVGTDRLARLVPDLGDDSQYSRRADILCRPELLRCMVEQRYVDIVGECLHVLTC